MTIGHIRSWIERSPRGFTLASSNGPASRGQDALPAEARFMPAAMLWRVPADYGARASRPRPARWGLVPARDRPAPAATASRSAWYGRVPVGKLRPGDVLACRFTSPVWPVLFSTSGTLVADTRRNPVARPPASLASIERPPGSPLATPRPISRRSGPHLGTAGRGRNDAVRRRLLAASPHGRVSNVQHVIGSGPLAGGTPVGASRVRASATTKPSGSIANWSSCLC
jgi:hypothetical protein